jgi:ferredoxin-NADP reductase
VVFHTLTRAPKGSAWAGREGRIDATFLGEVSRGLVDPVYYVCGAPGMVQDTYRTLQGLGVGPDRIKFELFRGYGGPPSTNGGAGSGAGGGSRR